MSRIELSEQFYEDEVREGFYVPACVKQAWGAQICVLNDIDKVCMELGIKYFADWGTFLGAVRHGGFIPWDDDFDICMLRDDYNKFLAEGVSRLPEGYAVFNLENKEDHEQFVANVVSRTRICFEPDHLERFHGFPYISAVDVFLIDYMASENDRQEAMKTRAKYVLSISDGIREGKLSGSELRQKLKELERLLKIQVPAGLTDQKIRRFLDMEAERLFASFMEEKDRSEQIVQMMPWGLNDVKIMPKWYYSQSVDIPFETGTIPVPLIYDDALRRHYGDYMQLYKNAGGHDYPFFVRSRAQLQEVLDFELPEYKIDSEEIMRQAEERRAYIVSRSLKKKSDEIKEDAEASGNTYREVTGECLSDMRRLFDKVTTVLYDDSADKEPIINICVDIQQLAIDLGTYMEAIKGEGYDLVALLENLCEELYKFTQIIIEGKENGARDNTIQKYDHVAEILAAIREKTDLRREILFLPFKDRYWNTMDPFYRSVKDDPDIDVYVVPIPYYYKDYKGQLINMQFCTEDYPADVELTHYDEYEYAVHHPDIIVIQSPYDNYNDEMSVPPFFYSDKLIKLTDRLVYIPWFETYDFTRENEREYINMNWYCTMPGVINADTVLLRSETIRNTYIEKLCDFAGDSTRELWNKKILVSGSEEANDLFGLCKSEGCEGITGKMLLYYPDFSEILMRGQQATEKMKTVINTLAENKDKLVYMILKGRLIENELKAFDKTLYDKYTEVIEYAERIMPGAIELVNESETDYDELVQKCVAYYGDAGHLAHMFRNAGKPVMIQNYEI
ncbi:MAG: LicD family protein [Lachnospiraceae bacterium]|nr:LicD family protein [Lachnospiraceae bacterium]